MDELGFALIFAKNLKRYMEKYELTQVELASRLDVSTVTIYNWLNGIKIPRMDKVDAMCKIFNCSREDMITDLDNVQEGYYNDTEVQQLAQEVYENPELKLVFNATRGMSVEDIQTVVRMIRAYKGDNGNS